MENADYKIYMDYFDNKILDTQLCDNSDVKNIFGKVDTKLLKLINEYEKIERENYGVYDINFRINYSKKYCQKCFDIYKDYVTKKITPGEYMDKFGLLDIDRKDYFRIVFDYARYQLKMPNEEIYIIRKKGFFMRNILDLISEISDEKEIFIILTDCGQYKSKGILYGNKILGKIRSYIPNYVVTRYRNSIDNEEHNLKVDDLKQKMTKVINIYNKINKEKKVESSKKLIDKDFSLIKNYLSSDLSLKNYLLKNNVKESDFKKELDYVQEKDAELYKMYQDFMNQKKSQSYAILMNKNDTIVNCIKSGIVNEKTNKRRDFDILDYYIYSNISPEDFIKLIKGKYDDNDFRIVRTFFAKNKGLKNELKTIRNMKYNINSIEITDKQKELIIDYLKSINAPLSVKLFRIAIRRYLNNELILEEEQKSSNYIK